MTKFILNNQYYMHWCQGCKEVHLIPNFDGKPRWTFNGNFENPTLTPSVKQMNPLRICHYFITSGQIIFCGDCHHQLANKTVPLEDIPTKEFDWLT
jgi:uncharacterized protein YlaI